MINYLLIVIPFVYCVFCGMLFLHTLSLDSAYPNLPKSFKNEYQVLLAGILSGPIGWLIIIIRYAWIFIKPYWDRLGEL